MTPPVPPHIARQRKVAAMARRKKPRKAVERTWGEMLRAIKDGRPMGGGNG